MNVNRLHLRSFTVHNDTELYFPTRGLVLVTGHNGSGKSSVVEGVSMALWGRSLRGADPWQGGSGSVELDANAGALNVLRGRVGNKSSLTIRHESLQGSYDTQTKAQEGLESLIGEWEVWRRTSVFSSADAAHFSLATDAERKRMLESLLALTAFDLAYEKCREDKLTAGGVKNTAERELSVLQERIRGATANVARATASLLTMKDPTPVLSPLEVTLLKMDQVEASRQYQELSAELSDINKARGALEARHLETNKYYTSLNRSHCPSCSQKITPEIRAELEARVAESKADLIRKQNETYDHLSALMNGRRIIEVMLSEYGTQIHQYNQDTKLNNLIETQKRSALAAKETAENELATAQDTLAKADAALGVAQREFSTLGVVSEVLGLKGVRAQLLARTLSGIEHVANAWLSRIAGEHLRVTLSPQTEKRSGGISDVISLRITGAGGRDGYAGASGGERRRIDVALLLALAEIGAGASGRAPGTLFFDEVFDALDVEGTHAVCSALYELSQTRTVVVISHSQELMRQLRHARHWHFEKGRLKDGQG